MGGLIVAAPVYASVFGRSSDAAMVVIIALSIAVMTWAPVYNTIFDRVEFNLTGRVASDRPHFWRIIHALLHEATSIVVTLPLIMVLGHHGFWEALTVDIGLTLLYAGYAYVFYFTFDQVRPVAKPATAVMQVPYHFAATGFANEKSVPHMSARQAPQHFPIPGRTEKFGVHIMIDGYRAPMHILEDEDYLRSLLVDLPRQIGMHAISMPQVVRVGPMNRKDPGGISGFVMIAESHISFHTFPARGFVTMDLYTCQSDIDTTHTVALLKQAFRISDADVFIQDRGLRYPSENLVA